LAGLFPKRIHIKFFATSRGMRHEVFNSTAPVRKSAHPGSVSVSLILAVLVFLLTSLITGAPTRGSDEPQQVALKNGQTSSNLNGLVRDVLQHEVRAQAEDDSLWCYRKLQEKDGKVELFASCQTKGAEINRLLAVDGKPLTAQQSAAEEKRIEKLLNDRDLLKKRHQQQDDDAKQAATILKILPDAFVFEQEKNDGERITLRFSPNPNFHPSGFAAQVLYHLKGTLELDLRQKRLVEISGRLESEVKFLGGVLGHLDKGGTFFVKQQEITPGCWEMTTMDVRMDGKALLFKTIAVRTKEIDTDFHRVPPATSIQQIAMLTTEIPGATQSQK
jgi:hypothetical protein